MENDNHTLLIILGNQLFPLDEIKKTNTKRVFMAEDYGLCSEYKNHKLKILMFLSAMREYRNELEKNGIKVFYHSIEDSQFRDSFEEKIHKIIQQKTIKVIKYFEIEDKFFDARISKFREKTKLTWIKYESPMFLCSRYNFELFFKNKKTLRMAPFYQYMRKKYKILLDSDNKPIGGKWSFDDENRKKLPKNITIPSIPKTRSGFEKLKKSINNNFPEHPGIMNNFWMPITRKEVLIWLDNFLLNKLENFGSYEDAVSINNNFLFHSAISPSMNLGLITPREVIDKVIDFHEKNNIPMNSLEGFIRQVIGWREFIRGTYHLKGDLQVKSNFWSHSRKLSKDWYDATTGIDPLDDIINDCINYGYTHHIPRLMIVSNIMNLCRIHPSEIYKWFMEMFVDSSDWVMVPNVYGMGTYADGGMFSTKPYLCGSNYILKMSNYRKSSWCDVVDGLYWSFINDNKTFFNNSPRISFLPKMLDKMNPERKKKIFLEASKFKSLKTI